MDSIFIFKSYTPSLIVLLDNRALMYDMKDCHPKRQAEGCSECHTSKPTQATVLVSMKG